MRKDAPAADAMEHAKRRTEHAVWAAPLTLTRLVARAALDGARATFFYQAALPSAAQ